MTNEEYNEIYNRLNENIKILKDLQPYIKYFQDQTKAHYKQEKSLLLQHPAIINTWLDFVGKLHSINPVPETYIYETETELFEKFLREQITRYRISCDYYKIATEYDKLYKGVIEQYANWFEEEWIGKECEDYLLKHVGKIGPITFDKNYIRECNELSKSSMREMNRALSRIHEVLKEIINSGKDILGSPLSQLSHLADMEREYARLLAIESDSALREELDELCDGTNGRTWEKMREKMESVICLAVEGKLCNYISSLSVQDKKLFSDFGKWLEDDWPQKMEDNANLLEQFQYIMTSKHLFALEKAFKPGKNLHAYLNAENLDLFNYLVLRCNIILTQLSSELKTEYNLWLKSPKAANEDIPQLSHSRQAIYDAVMKYIGKGDWKAPATVENVKQFMNVVLGREPQKLDAADRQMPEKLWSLFEHGRTGKNTRIEIAWANIVGFLSACNLLSGGSTVNNQKFFGQGKELISNIDHGGKMEGKALSELKPFLEKYCDKIIKGI